MRRPNQSWQEPADPVLRDQSALRERRRHHRFLADETHVGIERENKPNPRYRTVDRCDDRLLRAHEVRKAPHVREFGIEIWAQARLKCVTDIACGLRGPALAFGLNTLEHIHI